MVDHSDCVTSGIYSRCALSCPSSPKTFFSSLHALNDHCAHNHPHPRPPPVTNITTPPATNLTHNSPLSISTQLLHIYSPPNANNHWVHVINFKSISTNHQTSKLHGVTSSTLRISQHFVTPKLPSSMPLLLPPLPVTPSMTLYLFGGYYCFASTCLSLHHPHVRNTTTHLFATPSVIALMQHFVVILHPFSIPLCRYTTSNRTATPHITVTTAAPNMPLTTMNIAQLFHELAHLNQLQQLAQLI